MKAGVTEEKAAQLLRACKMRIGLEGYARIIGSLRGGPKSTAQLATLHGVHHNAVLHIMRHCLKCPRPVVHRENWFRPQPHARLVPMWALGAEGDVSMPQFEERTRRPRRAPSTLILLTTTIELLSEAALTRNELAAELCMNRETGERLVKALRDEAGLLFVESWHKPPTGTSVAEWRYGQRRDAPRPKPRGTAAYWQDYKARRDSVRVMRALAGMGGVEVQA